MPRRKRYDVFVSYSHNDAAIVKPLVQVLSVAKRRVFWDEIIEPGQEWNPEIEHALAASDAVVLMWCCDSAASQWVTKEIDSARKLGKPLTPMLLCAYPLRGAALAFQAINLSGTLQHACDCASVEEARRLREAKEREAREREAREREQPEAAPAWPSSPSLAIEMDDLYDDAFYSPRPTIRKPPPPPPPPPPTARGGRFSRPLLLIAGLIAIAYLVYRYDQWHVVLFAVRLVTWLGLLALILGLAALILFIVIVPGIRYPIEVVQRRRVESRSRRVAESIAMIEETLRSEAQRHGRGS
jgi:hypothetical protein